MLKYLHSRRQKEKRRKKRKLQRLKGKQKGRREDNKERKRRKSGLLGEGDKATGEEGVAKEELEQLADG